jgi:S1-C subfamily serine protease
VPINTVRSIAAQLIKTGKVAHPFLGISVLPVNARLAQVLNLPAHAGLLVETVDPSSGAAKAGIEAGTTNVIFQGTSYPVGGDIIVGVDGTPVSTFAQLRDAVMRKRPGDRIALELYRHGKKLTVHVTLGNAPK